MEEREALMVPTSYTGGPIEPRTGHFLKSWAGSLEQEDSSFKPPRLSPKEKWSLNLNLRGFQVPWEKWVDRMFPKHHFQWNEVGILDAILSSKYSFKKHDELILGVTERWCAETNTFVFPWGEASITLEDVMILGGLSVLGSPYFTPLEEKHLMEIETIMKKEVDKFRGGKNKTVHTHKRWINFFMRNNRFEYEHEAFLTSWLSMFVFPADEIYMINDNVLPTAIRLARGTRIALAPPVLAGLYTNLSVLKGTMADSIKSHHREGLGDISQLDIFWSPFHLVQLWAWERLKPFRPNPNPLKPGEPRVARWNNVKTRRLMQTHNGNVRNTIDSCGEVFLWRPYCLPLDNWIIPSFYVETEQRIQIGGPLVLFSLPNNNIVEIESFARCLRVCHLVGTEGEEAYQPHRVAMQFGYDQDLPGIAVSRLNLPRKDLTVWVEREYYSRNITEKSSLHLPPRMAKPEVTIRYLNWWRKKVWCLLDNSIHMSVPRKTFTMIDLNLPPVDSLLLRSESHTGQNVSTNSMIDLNLTPPQSPNMD